MAAYDMDAPKPSRPSLRFLDEVESDEGHSDDDSSSPDLSQYRVTFAEAHYRRPCTDCGIDFCPGDICVEEPFTMRHPIRRYCRDCWSGMTGIKHHRNWSSTSEDEDGDMGEEEGSEEEPWEEEPVAATAQQSSTAGTHVDAQAEVPRGVYTHSHNPGRAPQVEPADIPGNSLQGRTAPPAADAAAEASNVQPVLPHQQLQQILDTQHQIQQQLQLMQYLYNDKLATAVHAAAQSATAEQSRLQGSRCSGERLVSPMQAAMAGVPGYADLSPGELAARQEAWAQLQALTAAPASRDTVT